MRIRRGLVDHRPVSTKRKWFKGAMGGERQGGREFWEFSGGGTPIGYLKKTYEYGGAGVKDNSDFNAMYGGQDLGRQGERISGKPEGLDNVSKKKSFEGLSGDAG